MADYLKFDYNLIGLGVAEMDHEHKTLVSKMNELHRVHSEGKPFEEVKKKLLDLKDYTVQHFKDEEKYMESIGFEGLDSHKIIHQRLLTKFIEHEATILRDQTLTAPFFEFLKSWLVTHIRGIDSKYAGKNLDAPAAKTSTKSA